MSVQMNQVNGVCRQYSRMKHSAAAPGRYVVKEDALVLLHNCLYGCKLVLLIIHGHAGVILLYYFAHQKTV